MSAHGENALHAAHPRRSAWVSAHAGSGKTYTLANRVTRLLLDGAKPERILCLTYTKSAAAEMQGRLFEQLGSWAMLPDKVLAEKISEIGGDADGAEGLRRARRLFALALETPGGLKIQTIHSFCQYLLSRFPLEAGIPPGFRVLDEQTARELIGEARARVLEMASAGNEQLAGAAAHLVTQTSETRLQQILDAALGNDRGKLERFFAQTNGDGAVFARAIREAHGAGERDTVERIAADFSEQIKREEDRLRAAVAWLSGGKKTDIKRAEAIAYALELDGSTAFEAFRDAFLTSSGKPYASLATKGLADAEPELLAYLESWAARVVETDERCRAAHAASLAEAALTLAEAVRKIYAEEKRFRGVLDYDDLIGESLTLLKKREAAAWVLYKMDGGLDHILIDEAQDTSPEQWEIVKALTEEFFAGEGIREAGSAPRTIFAVGDEKQSIFSFQGADPREFEVTRRHFELHAKRDGEEAFVDVQLATSRRSAPEILQFVDAVFADPDAREGLTSAEGALTHIAHRADAKGRVEFWPALKPDDSEDPNPWRPVDVEPEASPVRRLAERLAAQIKQWTDGRTRLPGHEKPIRPGDIMILMPRREPFASEIIRQLKERGIAVAGADRIRLTKQIAVMDLIALGRFVLLPEDDLNLAALLRSPMLGLSEEELYALCADRAGLLWRELERREGESASFGFAYAFLKDMRAAADYKPPYEFYAGALMQHGMRKRLIARLGTEANDAIDEFLSLALDFEALNTPGLESFLHWVERGETEIKRDMDRGRDEVRVMTVHGAKGLEADIVILPDTTTLPDPPGKRGDLLFTEEGGIVFPLAKAAAPTRVEDAKEAAKREALKEHRRLLYVALTRARERLVICGFENRKGVREGSWYDLCERAAEKVCTPHKHGDETVFVLGEADVERAGARAKASEARPALPDWATRPPAAEQIRTRIIRPSEAIEAEEPAALSPLDAKGAARFRRGLLVHALLARLPDVAESERRAIALKFLARRGVLADTAEDLADETLAVLSHPDFAPAFSATARAEVAIVAELPELGPGARITGRIDRIAMTDGEVLAVDFKTNRPPPERVQDVPKLYIAQMTLYRAALEKVFPGKRIGTALVWTEGPRLMRLPDEILDAERAAIRARLIARAGPP